LGVPYQRKAGAPPLPFLPLLCPSLHSPSLPLPLWEVAPLNPVRGFGKRCKLPQRGPLTEMDFGAFWPLNLTSSGGNILNNFPENQLPKFQPLPSRLGDLGRVVTLSYEL